jgi:endonuclease G
MSFLEKQIKDTESRYSRQSEIRKIREENMKKGDWTKVDDPKRIRYRMERLGMVDEIAEVMADMGGAEGIPQINVLERILEKSELTNVSFLLEGACACHSVGRIVIRSNGTRIGYGTGFMVSPRLMMTNNHVLESSEIARNSVIQFNYQEDFTGKLSRSEEFSLEPDVFFRTNKNLDFTLLAISTTNASGKAVREFGWNPLIARSGKAIFNDRVNIIQHPGGDYKKVALRENQIIDIVDDFLHYKTDTMPGSSGSPVYNDQWEVAALHHSGVPARKNGKVLLIDGSPWDGSRSTIHRIKWIANEGVRISSIVKYVKTLKLSREEERLFEEALNSKPEIEKVLPTSYTTALLHGKQDPISSPGGGPRFESDGTLSWLFKLNFGLISGSGMETGHRPSTAIHQPVVPDKDIISSAMSDSDEEDIEDEAVSIDQDYSNRKGYNPKFLGSGDKEVNLPELSDLMKENIALNRQASDEDKFILPYHHYSVVMNGKRRLAYFVAVNIDGKTFRHVIRERDKWFFDPRIKRDEQIGNYLYKNNPLDRGHLVRRQDPSWGKTFLIAKIANDDTFHYTNCAPQHEGLNRSDSTWQGLEDYILDNAKREDIRVSVFSGPVFRNDDPFYRGIQLPREFWKVVLMVKEDETLLATAYLLSQANLIQNLEEFFTFGAYKTFQVPISDIESLTGLKFGKLKNFDPINSLENFSRKEIFDGKDLILQVTKSNKFPIVEK